MLRNNDKAFPGLSILFLYKQPKPSMAHFSQLPNWADPDNGAQICYVTDDQLGAAEHLLQSGRGGVASAWLTQRRRQVGQEFCLIRLGEQALLRGLEIDTHGDCPPYLSAYACCLPLESSPEQILAEAQWDPLIKKMALQPNQQHWVDMMSDYPYTHIRVMLYPDGGLSRFRAYGHALPSDELTHRYTNFAQTAQGAQVVACSEGAEAQAGHLLDPTNAIWRTPRNRFGMNHAWVVIALKQPIQLHALQIDTRDLLGETAAEYAVEGFYLPEGTDWTADQWATAEGIELVERWPMDGPRLHHEGDLGGESITHVRLSLYPDGAVRQLYLWGTLDA